MQSTTRYKRGDIVLVTFPFTDLTSSKRRPALVISPDSYNENSQDLVLAAITTQLIDEPNTIILAENDFVGGKLPKPSAVKLTKMFTMHSTLVRKRMCALNKEKMKEVLGELRSLFS